jgi:hypothetical protein
MSETPEYQSENEEERQRLLDRAPQQVQTPQLNNQEMLPGMNQGRRTYGAGSDVRTFPIRESRIKDRAVPKELKDSSLKIKIELDLEVEVDLYARVKGDVTIGLI